MLWTIAVILIILWMLGLVTGFTGGSFIHVIFAAAVALLVVSLSQEVMINHRLRHAMRSRDPKPDSRQRHERLADPADAARRKGLVTNHFTTNIKTYREENLT